MDTIFDKPLNKELNDKPDYATEMPMSSSDSITVSQAIANLDGKVSYENTITDLNTATEAGTYYYGANSSNAPATNAGRLIVMKSSESKYGTQIASINSASTPFIYARSITSSGFGSWKEIPIKNTFMLPQSSHSAKKSFSGTDAQSYSLVLSEPAMVTLTAYNGGAINMYAGSDIAVCSAYGPSGFTQSSLGNSAYMSAGTHTVYYKGATSSSSAIVQVWTL